MVTLQLEGISSSQAFGNPYVGSETGNVSVLQRLPVVSIEQSNPSADATYEVAGIIEIEVVE